MDAQDGHPSRFLTVSSKLKILTSDVSQPVTVVCSTNHYLNKIHWMGRILRDKENFTVKYRDFTEWPAKEEPRRT